MHKEHKSDVDAVQMVHKDGTVDYVDTHAIGGDLEDMPKGYYYSVQFIGTVTVSPFPLSQNRTNCHIGSMRGKYMCISRMGSSRKHSVRLSPLLEYHLLSQTDFSSTKISAPPLTSTGLPQPGRWVPQSVSSWSVVCPISLAANGWSWLRQGLVSSAVSSAPQHRASTLSSARISATVSVLLVS
jgi:hypothetical protein